TLVLLFFFFFQAEDGIRDDLVTGVQTCALPISGAEQIGRGLSKRPRRAEVELIRAGHGSDRPVLAPVGGPGVSALCAADPCDLRSEERRVGKEGRSWGSGCE